MMIDQGMIEVVPSHADFGADGTVHHCRLLEYAERGRVALLEKNGIDHDMAERLGCRVGIYSASMKLTGAVMPGDIVQVHTAIKEITGHKIWTKTKLSAYRMLGDEKAQAIRPVDVGTIEEFNVTLGADGEARAMLDNTPRDLNQRVSGAVPRRLT